MRVLVFCLLFLAVVPSRAGAREAFPPERLEELQATLERLLRETGTPGLGAALVTAERVVWVGGLGWADRETRTPVTAETVFRIGSISKSFVALAALMLVEEGRLDLQAPLRSLAPEIEFENPWEASDPVRFVHLLEHTTGWGDLALCEYAHNHDPPVSLAEGLAFHPDSRRSRWPPGRSMSYCNSGPAVAAYVIQKITGVKFEDFVEERIFRPLAMPVASFLAEGVVERRLASGYTGVGKVAYWHLLQRPFGSVNATAGEMANYLRMFLNRGALDGVRLVEPESVARMMESHTTRASLAGVEQCYGLHLVSRAIGGFRWCGHNGALDGYRADLAWCPKLGVGYVFMINSSSGPGFAAIQQAFREFLAAGHAPDPLPPVPRVAPEVLASYEGFYQPITPRHDRLRFLSPFLKTVLIQSDGVGLRALWVADPLRSGAWVPVTETTFRRRGEPLASVVFYGGEDEGEALFGVSREYRRVPALAVWGLWTGAGVVVFLMGTSLLFALVWIPRLLFGRGLRKEPFLSVRVVPFLGTVCFAAAVGLLVAGREDVINRFGRATPWSVGFMLLTILFALCALVGWGVTLTSHSSSINRGVRTHALLVSTGQVALALYLAYWGVIGVQTWM